MPAAYDNYDYPSYWIGREYEHEAEVLALKNLLKKIPKINTIVDIGAGYGRLTPYYSFRAKKVILTDPSSKLLKIARLNLKDKKIKYIHSKLNNLTKKIKKRSIDLAIIIRVLHHIENLDEALINIQKLLKKNSYLILEFPNKSNLKAVVKEILKGNLTYPLEIFPKDKRSLKSQKAKTIHFSNYHPDQITEKLKSLGFTIIETLSVSNTRSVRIKKILSKNILLFFEKLTQKIFSKICFGPSIFILAKNTK